MNTDLNTSNKMLNMANESKLLSTLSHILVVDDETDLGVLYETTLKRAGYTVSVADGVQSAKKILTQHRDIACVISDFRMNDGSGLDLLRYITDTYTGLPVCLVTAYSSPEHAIQALKEGAFDYLSKPVSVVSLRRVVAAMVEQNKAHQADSSCTLLTQIIEQLPGQSTAMKVVHHTLFQLAQTDTCVVIQGEPGTGKELAARALHAASIRAVHPFIVIDCRLLKDSNIAEKALFGETGIKPGAFQLAQKGTLLLDEVHCLPIDIQTVLLSVLQNKTVSSFDFKGIQSQVPVDIRLLISSTTPLNQWVTKGHLRQDLYYRLNIMTVHLPSLRDRSGDAPWLAQQWLSKHRPDKPMTLSTGAIAWLRSHIFSGNIRELNNIIERAVAMCTAHSEHCIDVIHLQRNDDISVVSNDLNTTIHSIPNPIENKVVKINFPIDLAAHLASIERNIIEQALQYSRYNRSQAATLLGINIRQIRYRIEQLGIEC